MPLPLGGLDLGRCLLVGTDQGLALQCKSERRSVIMSLFENVHSLTLATTIQGGPGSMEVSRAQELVT